MKANVFLLHLAFSFATHHHLLVASCPNVPSMTVEAACRKVSGTKVMYDMCMDTLRDIPDPSNNNEATVYALAAARRALESYNVTMNTTFWMLFNASLAGDERQAYTLCMEWYTTAEEAMGHVADDMLPHCRFDRLNKEYMDGLVYLESCRERVSWLKASPLYAMIMVDRNKALLAYILGRLLGIITV